MGQIRTRMKSGTKNQSQPHAATEPPAGSDGEDEKNEENGAIVHISSTRRIVQDAEGSVWITEGLQKIPREPISPTAFLKTQSSIKSCS